jgi:Ca2+-binding RTX toxin-like protein
MCICEGLEERTLFAATPAPAVVTVAVVENTLQITGTRKADVITVGVNALDPNLIEVRSGAAGETLLRAFNRFELYDAIVIAGGKGNDVLTVDPGVTFSVVLLGDAGKDVLTGGGGDDVIDGGAGNDRLLGSDGDDLLEGGPGKDQLDGGRGDDSLSGGVGKDAVAGGEGTDLFDDDAAFEITDRAADEILTEPVLIVGRRQP